MFGENYLGKCWDISVGTTLCQAAKAVPLLKVGQLAWYFCVPTCWRHGASCRSFTAHSSLVILYHQRHWSTDGVMLVLCRKLLLYPKAVARLQQSRCVWLKYATNRLSAGASPKTPLGESLQRSPRITSWFRDGIPGDGRGRKGGQGGQVRKGQC